MSSILSKHHKTPLLSGITRSLTLFTLVFFTNFNQVNINNAGLLNGRLEASSINGTGTLICNALLNNLSHIDISFTGKFDYSYSGTDSVNETPAFNLSYAHANILLSDITQISFSSHNTTGKTPT